MSFLTTASLAKKSKKKSAAPGPVEHVSIDVESNGYTVSCMHEGEMGMGKPESKLYKGAELESLLSDLRTKLTGAVKDEAAEPQPDTDDMPSQPAEGDGY